MNSNAIHRDPSWDVRIEDLPKDRPHQFEHLIKFAILAPSTHNTQPWRFAIRDEGVDVFCDQSRWLRSIDPDKRELMISVGCAVEALALAAEYSGFVVEVNPFPDNQVPDLVARIDLANGGKTSALSRQLFPYLSSRRTNRGLYRSTELLPKILDALARAVNDEEIVLKLSQTEAHKQALEALMVRADAVRFGDPEYRRELAYWMREGAYDESWFLAKLHQLGSELINQGSQEGRQDGQRVEASANFGVLASLGDSPAIRLRIGRAFMRLCLAATAQGLAVQPMNQVLEDRYFRARVFEVLFEDVSKRVVPFRHDDLGSAPELQIAFRIGYAETTPSHAPRRPLAQVLVQ